MSLEPRALGFSVPEKYLRTLTLNEGSLDFGCDDVDVLMRMDLLVYSV